MRRIVLFTITALIAAVALPIGAHAAPPAEGAAPPQKGAPRPIDDDYVGPARVGPHGYCGPHDGAFLCVDVVLRRCQRWTKRLGTWRKDGYVSNFGSEIYWVAPYGGGYHWTWNFGGYHAVATSCLERYEPTYG